MTINGKEVGGNSSAYIVAELSANHLNDFDIVEKTVVAAAEAGVDAIKLATLTPDTMTLDVAHEDFLINAGSKWDGRTLYDLYSETCMPYEWHESIVKMAVDHGLDCFSTPYDISAARFLYELDMPAYKIASFEITDVNLIKEVASYGKPVIISTGIAEKADIALAVDVCKSVGNNDVIVLKCTSGYPAPYSELNLNSIKLLKSDFAVEVGLSDHTLGIEVPVAAVSLGAKFIEKHIILERSLGGPDSHFSLEPKEFKSMVKAVRNVEAALGEFSYNLPPSAKKSKMFARSLYVSKTMKKGDIFSYDNIKAVRPSFGMHPKYLNALIGKKASKNIEKGTRMSEELIEGAFSK